MLDEIKNVKKFLDNTYSTMFTSVTPSLIQLNNGGSHIPILFEFIEFLQVTEKFNINKFIGQPLNSKTIHEINLEFSSVYLQLNQEGRILDILEHIYFREKN